MRKKSRAHTNNTRKRNLVSENKRELPRSNSHTVKRHEKSFVVENAAAKEKAKRNKLNQQNLRKVEEEEMYREEKIALIKKQQKHNFLFSEKKDIINEAAVYFFLKNIFVLIFVLTPLAL